MLEAKNLDWGQRVRDVSLSLASEQLHIILGGNGSGKTSLCQLLSGLQTPTQGAVHWLNRPITHYPLHDLAQQRAMLMQHTPQQTGLRVTQILALGLYPHGINLQNAATQFEQVNQICDITPYLNRPYDALSGGEQQRVQLARTLLQVLAPMQPNRPRLLILDEPTAHLDLHHQHQLLQHLPQLAKDYALCVICVLHDINLAAQYADTLLLMHEGRMICTGTPDSVLQPHWIKQAYQLDASIIPHPKHLHKRLVLV